jgi:hypothetical protein
MALYRMILTYYLTNWDARPSNSRGIWLLEDYEESNIWGYNHVIDK